MSFSPEYVRLVLADNFEEARRQFLEPLIAIHQAHLVMLAETGIVPRADARAIGAGLAAIDPDAVRRAVYDGSCEDLFFYLNDRLAEACGVDLAGRLHTARSRNDIDMTMYRMRTREHMASVADAVMSVRRTLLALAGLHRETVFAAHTHTQPAQPTTLAHYLLAMIEELERDTARLVAAYDRTNRNPLGACAITGTGFPIDRARTSALLGFTAPTGNTYGSIAAVDDLLEAAGAVTVTVAGLGRFVQDMLFWCTSEVGYLRLDDGFVQISSIMPQKRNPVALEHARALLSKALGQALAVPMAVHNTPFGDIVDTEDDMQPLVAAMFRDAARGIALIAAALASATFDVQAMRARAEAGWVSLTEVADTLAREHGLSFSAAHQIATRLAAERHDRADVPLADIVARASREIAGRAIHLAAADLERLLSPDHFVRIRRTLGGPAPEVTATAIAVSIERLAADDDRLAARRAAIAESERLRARALAAL